MKKKQMDLIANWNSIRKHFSKSFFSSLHFSIASVDSDNNPTVTPIGTVFLNKNQTGFYFEEFTSNLPNNSKTNKKICILAVNSSKLFWLKSLFQEKFNSHPAIKLYGKLGEKRKATENELRALKRRMRYTQKLKGHKYLWNNMSYVRDITFEKAEKMNIGKMTNDL